MLMGNLDIPETGEMILRGRIWDDVFEWLKKATWEDINEGEYLIREHEVYVKAQGYQTVSREEGRFEVHREYIDVQCVLKGAEAIEWCPSQKLEQETEYDIDRDVWFVKPPAVATNALILPRYYAVLWPGEAHMPKMRVDDIKEVFKVCVKIRESLFR